MKSILVCIDFSPLTDRLVEKAIALAKPLDATLHLVHVPQYRPDVCRYVSLATKSPQTGQRYAKARRDLQALAARIRAAGVQVTERILQGPVSIAIAQAVAHTHADMIIMGSHGQGAVHHLVVGSVAEGVLKRVHKPVLLVPAKTDND